MNIMLHTFYKKNTIIQLILIAENKKYTISDYYLRMNKLQFKWSRFNDNENINNISYLFIYIK